jgi:hypothetical protein
MDEKKEKEKKEAIPASQAQSNGPAFFFLSVWLTLYLKAS